MEFFHLFCGHNSCKKCMLNFFKLSAIRGYHKLEKFPCISEQPCKRTISFEKLKKIIKNENEIEKILRNGQHQNYLLKNYNKTSILCLCPYCKKNFYNVKDINFK